MHHHTLAAEDKPAKKDAPEKMEEQLLFNEELMKPHGPRSEAEEEAVPCVQGKIYSCRATVMGKVQQYAMSLGIAGMTIVFVEFVCLFASCCLACCVPKEEGGYSEYFEKIYPVAYYNDHYGGRKKAKGPRSNDGYY